MNEINTELLDALGRCVDTLERCADDSEECGYDQRAENARADIAVAREAIEKAKGFTPASQICQEAAGLWRERSLVESLERILKFQERGDLAAIWNEANSAIAKARTALANMVAATTEDSKLNP